MKKIFILSLSLIGLTMMSFVLLKNGKLPAEKKWKWSYTFTFTTGHVSTVCGGIGERCLNLVELTLNPCHIACWGEGGDCTHTTTIEVGFKAGTNEVDYVNMDLLNESDVQVLNMPSRSFPIQNESGNNVYLNVPSQVVVVDNFNPANNVIYSLSNCTVTNSPTY